VAFSSVWQENARDGPVVGSVGNDEGEVSMVASDDSPSSTAAGRPAATAAEAVEVMVALTDFSFLRVPTNLFV